MFHRHKDEHWEKVAGNVIEMKLLPAQYPPHPKVFVIQVHPEGRDPFRAEIPFDQSNWAINHCQ